MDKMSLAEIIQAVEGSFGYPSDVMVSAISTDTRKITEDCVFIALKGDNFDGHDYAAKAIELGAVAVISEKPIENVKCIVVDSTEKALLDLANHYRMKFSIPLIGITGSVGKTTTKEIIHCVVSQKYKTLKTQGNLNNEVGLPLTLFGLDSSFEAAIIEMGMSNAGEISRLSMCSCPTCAVITNIGFSHIENLGTQENILKAKLEVLDGADYSAPLILCKDDKLLAGVDLHGSRKAMYYSIKKKDCDVFATNILASESKTQFTINYDGKKYEAVVNCAGEHNVKNALAAFCVGVTLGIDEQDIIKGIAKFSPDGLRQNVTEKNGKTFIIDCYNAAPNSMKAALSVLSQCGVGEGGKRYAVLSDMLELGKMTKALHKTVGEYVAASKADYLVCYGANSRYYIDGAVKKGFNADNCHLLESQEAMAEYLKGVLKKGDTVMFKGSRGMKLEEVVNALE